jgi:hypothetical protein
MLYAVDKASRTLSAVSIVNDPMVVGVASMIFVDETLYASFEWSEFPKARFGTIDEANGTVSWQTEAKAYAGGIHEDEGTGHLYWTGGYGVARFAPGTTAIETVIPEIPLSTWVGIAADDDYLYWVQMDTTIRATGETLPAAIVRLPKALLAESRNAQ